MSIYLRELKANLRSLLVWSAVMFLLVLVAATKFRAYHDNPEMLKVLDSMPKALLDAVGLNGAFNLTTLTGFFGVMFTYFGLMGAVAAAMWGSDVVSKEERDRTAEFLLTLPVTRSEVVTAKALAVLTTSAAFVFVTWGISLSMAQRYHPGRSFYRFLALEMVAMFFIEIVFLALGLFLGCAMKRPGRSGSAALTVVLVTYFLSLVGKMDERLDFLKYFTPFGYFDVSRLLRTGGFDVVYLLLSAVLVAVFVAGAYLTYNRRDLWV